mgnify:CR=1 FL=1
MTRPVCHISFLELTDFLELVQLCKIKKDEKIIVLTETISREINFQLLEAALKQTDLTFTHIDIPTKPYKLEPIIKSIL